MEKEPIIEVRHMVKNFGPTRALRDVDVNFYRGEIRGLIMLLDSLFGKDVMKESIACLRRVQKS